MGTILQFVLPGLAAALVFYAVIMSCPFRYWLLKCHWVIDFFATVLMMAVFAGTYSGAMTGALGGIILTALLWGTWWWYFEPIPVRNDHEQSTAEG